jgi:putative ABC transport system permease protein
MSILRNLTSGLRALFHKEEVEHEMDEELRGYLDAAAKEKMRSGMSHDEARRAARVEMGSLDAVKEEIRSSGWEATMETLWQDLHYGLRQLKRNPGFTVVAVLTLALGIGANTAIFSVVDAVLLRPLPFHDPERLVQLFQKEAAPGNYPLTGPDYLDWQAQTKTLEGTCLLDWGSAFNASGTGEPEQAYVVRAQGNTFSLLGVAPLVGRTFLKGEDQAGRNNVAVLSYGFWQRHFGGRGDALGKDIELNGEKYAVVGVLPAGFWSLGGWADVWVPMDMNPKNLGQRGEHQYRAIGRLKPGVTATMAQAELETIAQRLGKQYPDSDSKGAVVLSLRELALGDSRPMLLILLGAVGLVLLIACANVANLSLVRATGRHREMAVRKAIGAGRARIVRQLLTESVLLSLLGAALGLLVGWGCLRLLDAAVTMSIPRTNPISLNVAVLAFTLGIGLLVGILVGLAPALQVSQLRLNAELKTTSQAVLSPSGERRILRDALVVCEIAISLALLVSAGLLLRSFAKLRQVQVGIHPEGLVTAQVTLSPKRYATLEQSQAFFDDLLEHLKAAPGVECAAVGSKLPLRGGNNGYVSIEGDANPDFEKILVEQNDVTSEYFRAFGIPFLKGRNFTSEDFLQTAKWVRAVMALQQAGRTEPLPAIRLTAVINQTMARQFWPNQEAVGKVFKLYQTFPVLVVGIVGDVKEWGIRQTVIPQAYYPLTIGLAPPVGALSIIVKGPVTKEALVATVRAQVHRLDNSLALFDVSTMQEIIAWSMNDTSYQSLLLSSFALLALLLTAVGIYGVMAYAVTQRTHEIGIRMALGANPLEILSLVLRGGAQITLVGVALGIGGALALTRFLGSMLFGVQPRDPITFVIVAILLSIVALLASYLPARRATKVDPMVALRYE